MLRFGVALAFLAIAFGSSGCGSKGDKGDGSDRTSIETTTPAETGPDLTKLPLGDGRASDTPKAGYIYSCQTEFDSNAGGAGTDGPWIDTAAGTWNAEDKVSVPGSVDWPHSFKTTLNGDTREIAGNDLPDHATGTFPIPSSSKAFDYDMNPNSISEQTIGFDLPANPQVADEPSCMGGESGVMLSGVALFNGFDAGGRDANAHELQDDCQGHPQVQGVYHYHSLSGCIGDNQPGQGHSPLLGYALDGFGIYGHHGENGEVLRDSDLDACHGHTHEIEWDGKTVTMYHYHATYEFPYVVGCFRGEPAQMQVVQSTEGGGGGAPGGTGAPPGPPPG
jgi:hypothetical protein